MNTERAGGHCPWAPSVMTETRLSCEAELGGASKARQLATVDALSLLPVPSADGGPVRGGLMMVT